MSLNNQVYLGVLLIGLMLVYVALIFPYARLNDLIRQAKEFWTIREFRKYFPDYNDVPFDEIFLRVYVEEQRKKYLNELLIEIIAVEALFITDPEERQRIERTIISHKRWIKEAWKAAKNAGFWY